jgi:DNA-binding CsgD family transcriptional regulator
VSQGDDGLERVMNLVGQVYDAALDERLWPSLGSQIAAAFEASSTAIQTRLVHSGTTKILTRTANITEEMDRTYCEYYCKHDLWYHRAQRFGIGEIFTSNGLVSDNELAHSEFFADWLRHAEQFYIVGSLFAVSGTTQAALGIHRPLGSPNFDQRDKTLFAFFLPHLRRALQVRERLAAAGAAAGTAFDALERSGMAALVAAGNGQILYANREAERLLRAGEGIAAVGGRLASARRPTNDRLLALIHASAETAADKGAAPGGILAIERDERLPLTVLVAPFQPAKDGFGAPLPAAIVFIRDPERVSPVTLALQSLFGLTPAEAGIAALLSEGRPTEDIAGRCRIAPNTVRMHLKSIFAKTGTSRQAQLVALILRSTAAL